VTSVDPAEVAAHLCPWCAKPVGELAAVCPACKTPLPTPGRPSRHRREPVALVRFAARALLAAAALRLLAGALTASGAGLGTIGGADGLRLLLLADGAAQAALLVAAAALLSLVERFVDQRARPAP
jgi:hypothetical protein